MGNLLVEILVGIMGRFKILGLYFLAGLVAGLEFCILYRIATQLPSPYNDMAKLGIALLIFLTVLNCVVSYKFIVKEKKI